MLCGVQAPDSAVSEQPPSPEDAAQKIRAENPNCKVAYLGMAADLIHFGHINIINESTKLGKVIVGVLTDEAVASYKRVPVVSFLDRVKVIQALKGVDAVVAQTTLDYKPNMRVIRPDFVVHGSDWRDGPQRAVRQEVIECLSGWGGQLHEPAYSEGISTTDLIQRSADRLSTKCPHCGELVVGIDAE